MPVTFSRHQHRSTAAHCVRFARATLIKRLIKSILLDEASVADFTIDLLSRIALPCVQLDLRVNTVISLTRDGKGTSLVDSPSPRAVNGDRPIDGGVTVIADDEFGEDADREIRIVDASVDRLIKCVLHDEAQRQPAVLLRPIITITIVLPCRIAREIDVLSTRDASEMFLSSLNDECHCTCADLGTLSFRIQELVFFDSR